MAVEAKVDALTRKAFDAALAAFVERGLSRVTAWTYLCQLRAVFARWCLPYYRDAGWEIPRLDIPVFRAKAPRYVRPSANLLRNVKAWYAKLTGEAWFAATMMLEFAVRNGDVLRLGAENFVEKRGGEEGLRLRAAAERCLDAPRGEAISPDQRESRSDALAGVSLALPRRYLCYTPHKTELTSGRRVCWPVHEEIWRRIEELGGMECIEVTDETFDGINRDLRALGFRGNKAAYELRKICIDHVYQKYGAEMAVSISGDDIKTISRYYADPSQPNIGAVRIVDLL